LIPFSVTLIGSARTATVRSSGGTLTRYLGSSLKYGIVKPCI